LSKLPELSYDPIEQILFVGFAGLRLESEREIDEAFEAVRRHWVSACHGERVYCVVDYTGFSYPNLLSEHYATCVKRAVETYSITTLRHTDDVSLRAALRVMSMKIHLPSNLYATRDEAIQVVRGLRAKRIRLSDSPPARSK
jgi:hypothetical protein